MNIAIRAHGIPAMARVSYFCPYIPATWDDPPDGPEVEFEILDSRGRKADWLDRIVTAAERKDIEVELINRLSKYEDD